MQDTPRIIHLRVHRNGQVHPKATMALQYTEDGKVRIGMSRCHPNDNFVKKLSKVRATGRCISKDAFIADPNDIKSIVKYALDHKSVRDVISNTDYELNAKHITRFVQKMVSLCQENKG